MPRRVTLAFVSIAAATLLAILVPASTAFAGCGGGGGGRSGGGGGSRSSGGGGSSGGEREVCVEVSRYVGASQCRRFGRGWQGSAPPFRLELGANVRRFLVGDLAFGGAVWHDRVQYQLDRESVALEGNDHLAGGLTFRVGGLIKDYMTLGLEISFGAGRVSGLNEPEAGTWRRANSLLGVEAGPVVGFEIPLGPVGLGAELFTGVRALMLNVTSVRPGCVETVQLLEWLPVFEPRLTARVFVAHGISIGGYVGANLARPGEAQGGLTLGFHTRGLDGVRSR